MIGKFEDGTTFPEDLREADRYVSRTEWQENRLALADAADRLLAEYERKTGLQVGKPSPGARPGQPVPHVTGRPERSADRVPAMAVHKPPLGRYGLPVGLGANRHTVLVEVHEPTFGEWKPGSVMASVYSRQGFEDSYGRVHQQRAFAVVNGDGYFVFKKAREMIAHGGDGPEAKPLREAVDAMRSMIAEGKWLEYSIAFGTATGICGVCHRKLDRPESLARGIGPVCARKLGG